MHTGDSEHSSSEHMRRASRPSRFGGVAPEGPRPRNFHSPPTSLVGEESPHLWPAFPRDPLGFSQIPGHCATQCRVVVIPDMVALTQNKIWVSLTSRRPHTSSTRTRRDQKSQRKRSPSTAARSRAQAASGCRRARSTAVHGGAEPAVAALVGASGVKMTPGPLASS